MEYLAETEELEFPGEIGSPWKIQQMPDPRLVRIANEFVLKDVTLPLVQKGTVVPEFIQSLDRHFTKRWKQRKLLLPNLREENPTIVVFSDYGGSAPDSSFRTYSILVGAYASLGPVLSEMQVIRRQYGLMEPFKEFNYKSLGYGPVQRALDGWLRCADLIPGLLFTMIVEKELFSILGENNRRTLSELREAVAKAGFGEWKGHVAEELCRIVHCVAYLVALLSEPHQDVFWMTDDDAIAPNAEQTLASATMLTAMLEKYRPGGNNRVGVATPFDEERDDYNIDDILSIPDLAAGSIEGLLSSLTRTAKPQVKEAANKALLWLSYQAVGLKKLSMILKSTSGPEIQTAIMEFRRKQDNQDIEYVPISL